MKERTISKSVSQWTQRLRSLGFDKIKFPILILDRPDMELVYSLTDFASDADLFHFPFATNFELLDSNGSLWTWTYDDENKTNRPDKFQQALTFEDITKIILTYFSGSKPEQSIEDIIANSKTIDELFDKIADKF